MKHSLSQKIRNLGERSLFSWTLRSFEKLTPQALQVEIRPLLDYLTLHRQVEAEEWKGWKIRRLKGGTTGSTLLRVTGFPGDFVVKYASRDHLQRAGREFGAMLALFQAASLAAPRPIQLDCHSYPWDVVVSTWLDGNASYSLPVSKAEWGNLLDHYVTIHRVQPGNTSVRLLRSVHNARNREGCWQFLKHRLAAIPAKADSRLAHALFERWEKGRFPTWKEPPTALCRVDANLMNFIRRQEGWASVDWDNSGWGDPAFDIALLITHPTCIGIADTEWGWFIETYCQQTGDPSAEMRIRFYRKTLVVWWVSRYAHMVWNNLNNDCPERVNKRIKDQASYEHYLALAETLV